MNFSLSALPNYCVITTVHYFYAFVNKNNARIAAQTRLRHDGGEGWLFQEFVIKNKFGYIIAQK